MKVALVCGHFIPEMGYIEVYLAKEFSRLGHEVNVFTTAIVPAYIKHLAAQEYTTGTSQHPEHGYTITRLEARFSAGQMVKAKGLKKAVLDFEPDQVIVIGLGKLFPKPLLTVHNNYRLVTVLGDNADNHEPSNRKPGVDTVKRWLKNPLYRLAVQHSDAIYSYTPETAPIVQTIIPEKLHQALADKNINISLGFDPDKFFYSEEERTAERKKLGIGNAPLLITATRIIPHKRLEAIIDWVNVHNEKGQELHYAIIGFINDAYGEEVKAYIAQQPHADKFHCFPFLAHEEVRQLYQAADLAYFPTAVISIFEAMGTGLPVVLPYRTNVSHIVAEGESGWYIHNDLTTTFETAYQGITTLNRNALAKANQQQFSYASIAEKILGN